MTDIMGMILQGLCTGIGSALGTYLVMTYIIKKMETAGVSKEKTNKFLDMIKEVVKFDKPIRLNDVSRPTKVEVINKDGTPNTKRQDGSAFFEL